MTWLRLVCCVVLTTFSVSAAGQSAQPPLDVPLKLKLLSDAEPPKPGSSASLFFDAPEPPPEKSTPLVWRHKGLATTGRWYTDKQVERIANNIWHLEDQLAKEKTSTGRQQADAQLAAAGLHIPKWVWITAGIVTGLAIGVGVGYLIWRDNASDSTPTAPAAQGLSVAW